MAERQCLGTVYADDTTAPFHRQAHALARARLATFTANVQMTCAANICSNWGSFARTLSAEPSGNEVIGIVLRTTNYCVSVMEGKIGLPPSRWAAPGVLPVFDEETRESEPSIFDEESIPGSSKNAASSKMKA